MNMGFLRFFFSASPAAPGDAIRYRPAARRLLSEAILSTKQSGQGVTGLDFSPCRLRQLKTPSLS